MSSRQTYPARLSAAGFAFPLEDRMFATAELFTDYRELVRMAASEIIKRVGLVLSDSALEDIQREASRLGSA